MLYIALSLCSDKVVSWLCVGTRFYDVPDAAMFMVIPVPPHAPDQWPKHVVQHWFNVGPALQTMAQHWISAGPSFHSVLLYSAETGGLVLWLWESCFSHPIRKSANWYFLTGPRHRPVSAACEVNIWPAVNLRESANSVTMATRAVQADYPGDQITKWKLTRLFWTSLLSWFLELFV